MYAEAVKEAGMVCPKCNYHFRITSEERLKSLFDEGEYEILDEGISSQDPLKFKDLKPYKDRLKSAKKATGLEDAVVNVKGLLEGKVLLCSCMEYRFMGGSMGSVVGEKLTRQAERALEEKTPLLFISCSGGARMQESALSLMQMAKVSAALGRLRNAGIPYISLMTDPTTGGVTASFAMLGDVNLSEPGALIGFAGPRVIEQTIRQTLPDGFQRAEFLLEKGMLDAVVPRVELRSTLGKLVTFLHPE